MTISFTSEQSQTRLEEIICKLVQETEEEGLTCDSISEVGVTPIQTHQRHDKKRHYRLIFLMDIDAKICNKLVANQTQY